MKVIDLINLYRLKNRDRIEIRKDNWFVLEAEQSNIPEEIKNKEVYDFCFSQDKLVINFSSDEVEIIEEDEEITKWGKGALEEIKTKKDYKINDLQKYIEILMETQNQIIDRLDELKKGK